ncbi:MAG: uroporphyrinogen-III C-methyltransferase [Selenomonadaceae bacterium]|nr:uroporphyrinogen-III C-methyltransferase [Selenomonadaceae bacterium]
MVYLIGAGPGDAGLLTVKAREILEAADVVIYDRLAEEKILSYAANAEKIYVGKTSGSHTLSQTEINNLLVEKGRAEKIVVRLKGGDPFVFGRGGEEALALRENGVDFEIISGVTSAIAVPACAGIPVTHRGVATSFAVVTGHEKDDASTIRWDKISTAVDTLIFLMGVENLPKITAKLIENGRAENTPAAVIRNGTKSSQQVLVSTLGNIAAEVAEKNITPPAIFIVGDVVNLREKICWFDNKPLFGRKILVTRARAQASKLTRQLENLGAGVIEFPTIQIAEPSDNFTALDAAIKNMHSFDWLIFTSANGVDKFFERLKIFRLDARALANAKVAAIGRATAEKLLKHGICADLIPAEFRAESLIDALKNQVAGKKILLARAETARDILPVELEKSGAEITVAAAYKTISAAEKNLDADFDMATFTSSSTVENFIRAVGAERLKNVRVAAIGPITAQTLEKFGVTADVIAQEFTIAGLVDAIKNFYGSAADVQ